MDEGTSRSESLRLRDVEGVIMLPWVSAKGVFSLSTPLIATLAACTCDVAFDLLIAEYRDRGIGEDGIST